MLGFSGTGTVISKYREVARYYARVAKGMRGVHPRTCTLCGYTGPFLAAGQPPRYDARCRACGSLERHRLLALWVKENEAALAGKRFLHFAPERAIRALFAPFARTLRTADLAPGRADLVLNIERIDLPDSDVDVVICSHVLEHVNDTLALAEIHRVLAPGGLAILMFPIVEGWNSTYENGSVTSDPERVLHFGQCDHIKYYGADVRERIRAAGFSLIEYTAEEPFVHRHGLLRGEKVFLARKSGDM